MEHKPMFYYNAKENKCVKFHYKGCEGNDNRFNKLVDCQAKCVK
ncbi:Kunitz-type serine protease inhibitor vestiginin-3, partial [Orchesella cincta]